MQAQTMSLSQTWLSLLTMPFLLNLIKSDAMHAVLSSLNSHKRG